MQRLSFLIPILLVSSFPLVPGCGPTVDKGGDDGDGGGAPSGDGGGNPWCELCDAGPLPPQNGCNAVDILVVIDNSGSMCFYQDALAQAFPGFADAMYAALPPGIDLHVGITTSSYCSGGSHGENNCVSTESAATVAANFRDPAIEYFPGNGYQGRLLEHEGVSYFTANTSDPATKDELSLWFSGAASSVGCDGCAFDFCVAASADLVNPANAATNAGFLRDEGAVLLVFVLSDEADHSPGSLAGYHDQLVAAKSACGGDACIITGALLSDYCANATPPPAIWTFLSSFGEPPVWGDISPDGSMNPPPSAYTAVVGDALAEFVKQTCDQIVIE